ncbi:MAG: 2-amino-4-hydroxy-6-hydroxymethyldihydropteridine diphosphokinase [Paludibacteraceae bacterium]|nr:2-amino-4-hydroxy-6-hydroxymethyldihydropteridine diphosphokinase [Paludibacteraceae bacterium]
MNSCVISLSSNAEAGKNISLAKALLSERFSDISFSSQIETSPFGSGYKANFQNLAARFSCSESEEEINFLLKQMETRLGRTPEFKAQKIVPVDLDIILWNQSVVRDDYYRFPFLLELINQLR